MRMYKLENGKLKAVFDGQGRILSLESPAEDIANIFGSPAPEACFLNCNRGGADGDWEDTAPAANGAWAAREESGALVFTCESLPTRSGAKGLSVELRVCLDDDTLVFNAAITNNGYDLLVTDFDYPKLGVVKKLGDKEPALYIPEQSGRRVDRIGAWLSARGESRESFPNSYICAYPGGGGTMQWRSMAGSGGSMHWMALCGGGQTLYAACHDPDYYSSFMRIDGSYEDTGAAAMAFSILPFVKGGETWNAPPVRVKLYKGDWHRGALEYRRWAETWGPDRERPEWIKDMLGYFLVINKQQYGSEMWPYDTLPKLYEMAKEHGCDTLGLFGWYDSGHDNQYPDLTASDSMGGAEALKENIKKVQEMGGHVTLYQQGHLIDTTTAFYRNGGYLLESRTRSNTPYFEYYNKSHDSMFLKYYTHKYFALSCPSCPDWRSLMDEKVDFAAGFGPDGVLFDQIGGMPPYPCFNEKHPHEKGKPSLSISGGRKKLLSGMHRRTKKHGREFAFFSEHITDVYAKSLDCLHGIGTSPSSEGAYTAEGIGPVCEPSLFRWCFPDTRITLRNQRPFISGRMANFAFTFGFSYEMEIRYQADCDDILADKWPREREYAKKISDLRARYREYIVRGRFADDLPLAAYNKAIIAKAFETETHVAVCLWNDSAQALPHKLQVTGATLVEYADADGIKAMPDILPARSIGLALYKKL